MRYWLTAVVLASALGGQAWGVYTFSTGTHNVSNLTTVDGKAIAGDVSLADGFTVPNGATVKWNFNGVWEIDKITGPIVVEAGGTLNITVGSILMLNNHNAP